MSRPSTVESTGNYELGGRVVIDVDMASPRYLRALCPGNDLGAGRSVGYMSPTQATWSRLTLAIGLEITALCGSCESPHSQPGSWQFLASDQLRRWAADRISLRISPTRVSVSGDVDAKQPRDACAGDSVAQAGDQGKRI